MDLLSRFHSGVAHQLSHPAGLAGRAIGRRLNKGNRPAVAQAVAALAPFEGATVADVGFGGGVGLELLLASDAETVHGVEVSTEMLRAARKRFAFDIDAERLGLDAGSMSALPLPDATLDGLITTNTIYFIADLAPAFAELARVLRPGGVAVLGLGDPEKMRKSSFTPYGFVIRPVEEVAAALAAAGLPVTDHQRVGDDPAAYHLLVATSPAAPR
ncbi:Arsenite methyltransferase [Baekduia alba]|uniref:class I SAM-dependent methyltransferase n=1 Tax=Baekduia alba TaxID=2997333 RepID=UPI00234114B1|nr:class I SAM-dependent methyltransferase [Baekduia alba]WCB94706.1 Arsenite methyltransferase [Baekduia alba]